MEAARDFDEPTALVIKHLNPCGAASAATLAQAFADAWAADPVSAFGGVLGFNRVVDVETAQMIGNAEYLQDVIAPRYREESGDLESTIIAAFVEAVIAPGYEPAALEILKEKKNMRVMVQPEFAPPGRVGDFDLKKIPGGLVVQTPDAQSVRKLDLKVVTKKQPTHEQLVSLLFADCVAKHVKSNAIVLVRDNATVGIGGGLPSRVDAARLAVAKAGERARGAVMASDAFFPFPDGVEVAAQAGVTAVVQPGGSVHDEDVIATADGLGLAMVFTGVRHFRH
jgi:phosphoribosylaminoimidazolecarboxamide formyltransferase/IMP cyclohydrolase